MARHVERISRSFHVSQNEPRARPRRATRRRDDVRDDHPRPWRPADGALGRALAPTPLRPRALDASLDQRRPDRCVSRRVVRARGARETRAATVASERRRRARDAADDEPVVGKSAFDFDAEMMATWSDLRTVRWPRAAAPLRAPPSSPIPSSAWRQSGWHRHLPSLRFLRHPRHPHLAHRRRRGASEPRTGTLLQRTLPRRVALPLALAFPTPSRHSHARHYRQPHHR